MKNSFTLWAAILVAGVLRIVGGEVLLSRDKSMLPDSELYWGIAQSVAAGRGFVVGDGGARRTPGYPLFLVGCLKLAGFSQIDVPPPREQLRAALLGNAVCAAITVGFVWLLARTLEAHLLVPVGTAICAAFLAAVDPLSIGVAGMVLSETPFTTFLVAAAFFLVSAGFKHKSSLWLAVAAGVTSGIAVLIRPSVLLLVPIAFAFTFRRDAKSLFLGLFVFIAVLSPWWIRNAVVYRTFIPTTLNVGESLYDGWNPNADGGSNMAFIPQYKSQAPKLGSNWENEISEDRHWRRAAVAWATENPKRVLELAVNKLGRFWSPGPNAAEFRQPIVAAGCIAFSCFVYVMMFAGWARSRRPLLLFLITAGAAIYFMTLHSVFVSSMRYRIPTMPILEVAAGAGLAGLLWRKSPQTVS